MAYNPYGYQNQYYPPAMPDNLMQYRQPQMMQQPVQQSQNPVAQGGVQWVGSEAEARGWMIAPNSAVALWDSTAPTVYLKQADASGKPSLKIYDLVERVQAPVSGPAATGVSYVTRDEFDRLAAAVAEMKGKEDKADG